MKKILTISAPAKAILCGQHAVVYGQDAIAFGVDLKCSAVVYQNQQQNDKKLNIISLQINISNHIKTVVFAPVILEVIQEIKKYQKKIQFQGYSLNEVQFQFSQFCLKLSQKENIEDCIILTTLYKIALFCAIFQISTKRFQQIMKKRQFFIMTMSQIPIGKGLGSSASFNSVLAASLMLILQILKRQDINEQNEHKKIVNYISKIFQRIEHGRPSGIDNFVSIYGGLVLYNKNKYPPFKHIENTKVLFRLSELFSVCFVDSGIQKNTKLAVSNVFDKYKEHLKGQNKYKHMIQQIGRFPDKIIDILGSDALNDSQVQEQLFSILGLNHTYLKLLGLSNETIQEIVQKYTIKNKSVAKITGSGMGGVVLIVGKKQFIQQLNEHQQQSKQKLVVSKMNTKGLQIVFE